MSRLDSALDALVPESTDVGDWDDVLRRATVADRRAPWRRRRGSRWTFAALGVALLAVPAAIFAAVRGRTDVLFSSSKPAPSVVKKRFADLTLGMPPSFAVQPRAAEARQVGTFVVRGKRRRLWVVPTRGRGFCYELEESVGGCVPAKSRHSALDIAWGMIPAFGPSAAVSQIDGVVLTRDATRIRVGYADGSQTDVSFVYVSPPISAGFFTFDVPANHRGKRTRAVDVVALDRNGHVLGQQKFDYARSVKPRHVVTGGPRRLPQRLPAKPNVPPSAPVASGGAHGVTVEAGANGVVVFDLTRADATTRSLLRRGGSYSCFTLVREFGIFDAKELGFSGRFQPTVAVRMYGLQSPFDGCEVQGTGGRRWPDANHGHGLVEIPLTTRGRRFFTDRAAARELSLFVRSAAVQRIRKEGGPALARDLSRYPLVRLASASESPPRGRIGWAETGRRLVFVEVSRTGRRFFVAVEHGKVLETNVRPYALVF